MKVPSIILGDINEDIKGFTKNARRKNLHMEIKAMTQAYKLWQKFPTYTKFRNNVNIKSCINIAASQNTDFHKFAQLDVFSYAGISDT